MQPIMFALKEGKGIEKDPFDYTLVMLQVTCYDTVKAPTFPVKSLKNVKVNLPKRYAPPATST